MLFNIWLFNVNEAKRPGKHYLAVRSVIDEGQEALNDQNGGPLPAALVDTA
jgi:hypothetical protein